jgi:hypothetical protein
MIDLKKVAQEVNNAYENSYTESGLVAALRVLTDELSYTMFLPGNDCRVIDARAVYKVADELEAL